MPAPVKVGLSSGNNRLAMSVPMAQANPTHVSVPKTHYLPPTAGQSSSAWTTSGAFLDYTLPQSLGVLDKLTLRLEVSQTVAAGQLAPPVPFWVQQVEVYIGGSQIEVIYPNELFNEVVGFKTQEALDTVGHYLLSRYNDSSGDTQRTIPVNPASGSTFYYLPVPNCLSTCHLYVAGVNEDVRFRIYFPPSMFPSTTTLKSAVLVIEEECGSMFEKGRWEEAHRDGVVYNTIVRQRQNQTITKSGTSANTVELTGLSGSTAGLVVYAGPPVIPGTGTQSNIETGQTVPVNQLLSQRYEISTSLELDDAMGAKRTEELRTDELSSFTWFSHVGTNFSDRFATYLIPFSYCFRTPVEDGANAGSIVMKGNDRLVVRGNAVSSGNINATETWNLSVVNYSYQALVFKNKKLTNVIRKISN